MYAFYPSRIPKLNSDDYNKYNLTLTSYADGGEGRDAITQGGYQMAALAMTLGMAIVSGILTGFLMKLPIFEQLKDDEDMFDDQSSWLTPSKFLKFYSLILIIHNIFFIF